MQWKRWVVLMAGKRIIKPEVNPRFFYGKIVSWKFRGKITSQRGKYCIRFTLTFENGEQVPKQVGGIKTLAEANQIKETILLALHDNKFVPFDFTAKEFFDFWLYYYMIDEKNISYNTFMSYRNIIYNYLLKENAGTMLKDMDRSLLVKLLLDFDTQSKRNSAYGIIGGAFAYAHKHNMLSSNPALSAIREVRGIVKRKAKPMETSQTSKKTTLNASQVIQILYTCKTLEPDIFIPLLLTTTTGIRISEALAVLITDIDFGKKELILQHQLGRTIDDTGFENDELYVQLIKPKTRNGFRKIPLADFVIDEIVLAIKRYQEKKDMHPDFLDYGFLACQANGKPIYKNDATYKRYRHLYEETGITYINWHGLRHTYATLLSQNNISLKAIAHFMGHSNPNFTKEVYIEETIIIYDATPEIEEFISEVMSLQPDEPCESIQEIDDMAEEYLLCGIG